MDTVKAFFFQNLALLLIFKKGLRRSLPSLLFACLIVAEYASISLNIPKCPWKRLNKLFWLCQGSKYALISYMFDRFLKVAQVLNIGSLVSEYGPLYMQGLHRVLDTSGYWSISLSNTWLYLDIPEHGSFTECP